MTTKEHINKLAPWFHNIHLPDGNQTAPHHFLGDFPSFKWDQIKKEIPENLDGWKVLDIGCNAGFYSIELAKRGAQVTAIDLDDHYLSQAKWVARQFGLNDKIQFKQMQVYDLASAEEKFDLIWFMGVFYHLRYPLLALDIISGIAKNMLVFQSYSLPGKTIMDLPPDVEFHKREVLAAPSWPKMAFIPERLAGDLTNWWVPNHQGILSILNNCGFKVENIPDDETYIAVRNHNQPTIQNSWNAAEYFSAIGKEWKNNILQKINKYHEI